MSPATYINFNGKFFQEDEAVIATWNRGFRYGDGLFEVIRIHEGEILFFADHLERMFAAMKALQITIPDHFSAFFFHKQLLDLTYKNRIGNNARIRIAIWRAGRGLYEPEQSDPEYSISVFPLMKGFECTEEPCELGIFSDVPKNFSSISSFKSSNSLCYVLAAIYREQNNIGDCILLNSFGKVADAISSNIFWIKDEVIFTVPLSDGGVDGIMRRNLMNIFHRNEFDIKEKSASPDELQTADEVFLTNVGWGIKPVTKFGSKKFSTNQIKGLFEVLMRELKK